MRVRSLGAGLAVLTLSVACNHPPADTQATFDAVAEDHGTVVVYSGRNESLIGPLLARFESESGYDVEVRYGETSELAATLLEEGEGSPAALFLSQDAAALGAVASLLQPLPPELLERVAPRFRDPEGRWVGLSGRARAVAYNPTKVTPDQLPPRLEEVTSPRYAGRYGVPPTNGSFQAHMAAYRVAEGEEALAWLLQGMVDNEAQRYPKNSAIVQAVENGEIEWGLVNHYYVLRALAENPDAPVAVHYMVDGEASNFVNMAGAGVLVADTATLALVEFLLGDEAQAYFAGETFEYPLVANVPAPEGLAALDEVPSLTVNFAEVSEALPSALAAIVESGLAE